MYGLEETVILDCASATRLFASATLRASSSVAPGVASDWGVVKGSADAVDDESAGNWGFLPVIAANLAAISARFCLINSSADDYRVIRLDIASAHERNHARTPSPDPDAFEGN